MPRPLGSEQTALLDCLKRKGYWDVGLNCGWTWGTYSNTIRILDTLVKRGLVETHDHLRYTPL
jgi:DNA-binding IclR family transcriptional regulator